MLRVLILPIFCINLFFLNFKVFAEISINDLLFNEEKAFHLRLLEALPDEAKIEYGSSDSKNIIIEFMDYHCGYCKKIHPELIEIANERDDLKIVFIQLPILSESSFLISKLVIGANFQNKGFDLHHHLFSETGSLTQKKLEHAIKKSDIDEIKLQIDMGRPEIEKIIKISSFLAKGIGIRGTPALLVNEEFIGGYVSKKEIIKLLN
tara:strand:+ start:1034 stop:1654 length:621 start_codon:yes stop_codon:yes gene_type:complete